jgi:hypothetical protein
VAIHDDPFVDDAAGRLVRPFAVSNGRTRPTVTMDMLCMIRATGERPTVQLEPEHARALHLCRQPTTVAEIAAQLRLPIAVAKIIVADLIDCEAASMRAPYLMSDPTNLSVLEKIRNGLRDRV